jgi:hypothetical protein
MRGLDSGVSHLVSQADQATRIRLRVHQQEARQGRSCFEEWDATPEHDGDDYYLHDIYLLRLEQTPE